MNKRQSSNQRKEGGLLSEGGGSGKPLGADEEHLPGQSEDFDDDLDEIEPLVDDSVGMRARMSSF